MLTAATAVTLSCAVAYLILEFLCLLILLAHFSLSSQSGHINAAFVSVTSPSFALNANMTKMDSLDSNASGTSLRDQAQISAVHAASLNGDKSSLAKLLVCTSIIYTQTSVKYKVLKWVELSAHVRDLDSGDKFGRSPLMYCVLGDRLECAEMLLKANADVNKKDIGGRTALHWAAHKVRNIKYSDILTYHAKYGMRYDSRATSGA